MKTNNFDPLAYIESAFLDREDALDEREGLIRGLEDMSIDIPSITDYLSGGRRIRQEEIPAEAAILARSAVNGAGNAEIGPIEKVELTVQLETVGDVEIGKRAKFKKTVMSAPRPRRSRKGAPEQERTIDPELQSVWQALPRNVAFLCSFYDDSVTKNYYRGEFKESRQELIRRLLDPELSLEETSRLLGVCPATVRRYTNRGWLAHHRTTGGQRRFRLSDIVNFVDEHGRFPEE